jgi:Asp-tRNA(Asn)/Glu-tRNA(Gln) amidotransferase C subunit
MKCQKINENFIGIKKIKSCDDINEKISFLLQNFNINEIVECIKNDSNSVLKIGLLCYVLENENENELCMEVLSNLSHKDFNNAISVSKSDIFKNIIFELFDKCENEFIKFINNIDINKLRLDFQKYLAKIFFENDAYKKYLDKLNEKILESFFYDIIDAVVDEAVGVLYDEGELYVDEIFDLIYLLNDKKISKKVRFILFKQLFEYIMKLKDYQIIEEFYYEFMETVDSDLIIEFFNKLSEKDFEDILEKMFKMMNENSVILNGIFLNRFKKFPQFIEKDNNIKIELMKDLLLEICKSNQDSVKFAKYYLKNVLEYVKYNCKLLISHINFDEDNKTRILECLKKYKICLNEVSELMVDDLFTI